MPSSFSLNRLARYLPVLSSLVLLVGLLVVASGNVLVAKKVVAHLLLPAGILWLTGWAAFFWPELKRSVRFAIFALWMLYTCAGSPLLGAYLLRKLESPFYEFEQPTSKLDALVLLGGGTALTPGRRPALGTHGDRLTRPAILYHEGLVATLVTTGRSITEAGEDRLLSQETASIWKSLGVPEDAILEVPEPRNTREELAAVAEIVADHPEWQKVGLCTSASHLSRAMAESRAQGLDLVPVPCDFRSGKLPFSPLYLVPQGRGFRDVQTALWEFLGKAT